MFVIFYAVILTGITAVILYEAIAKEEYKPEEPATFSEHKKEYEEKHYTKFSQSCDWQSEAEQKCYDNTREIGLQGGSVKIAQLIMFTSELTSETKELPRWRMLQIMQIAQKDYLDILLNPQFHGLTKREIKK